MVDFEKRIYSYSVYFEKRILFVFVFGPKLLFVSSLVYIDIVKMKIHLNHFIFLTCLFSALFGIPPISYQNLRKRMYRTGAGPRPIYRPIYDAHIFRFTNRFTNDIGYGGGIN